MPSNRWNLSTDYYDVLPADSEMDGEVCEDCGNCPDDPSYYIPEDDRCTCVDPDEVNDIYTEIDE